MKEITKLQQNTLDYIVKHIEEKGYPPSQREVGRHYGVTSGAIHARLCAMKKKGLLREEGRMLFPAKGKFIYVEK